MVQGVFTTRKYASRADFEAGHPYEIRRAKNTLTMVGLQRIAAILTLDANGDNLKQGKMIVGDGGTETSIDDEKMAGGHQATAELDEGYPLPAESPDNERGWRLYFRSTFGEDEANFDWHERGIMSRDGVLIDRSVEDQGRKAPGTVWTLEGQIEWVA